MLGLDVGGTKIELAIFDEQLALVESWRTPTPTTNYEDFLQTITEMVNQADNKRQGQNSVGIGIPGFIDQAGRTVSTNVPCLTGECLSVDLPRRLGRPVGIDNDSRNFVYSEANGGAGEHARHVLGVILGTGMAGNFCVDGKPSRGVYNRAGEYGHIPLSAVLQQRYKLPLRPCGCGAKGCIETYLSGPGLLWMSGHFGARFASVTALMDAVRAADRRAVDTFSAYVDCLGLCLAQMTLIFDPDVVVLGGGLSNIPELYNKLPAGIAVHLMEGFVAPPVVPPRFGDSSGVRGAAMIGRAARD